MNLVDSSGWLEYFTDGKNAKVFAPVIEKTDELIVSVINIYEVYKKIITETNERDALQAIGLMHQSKVIDVNFSIALEASKISYSLKIPMADSIIYVTGKLNDAIVWTQDYDFKNLEGVKFVKKN